MDYLAILLAPFGILLALIAGVVYLVMTLRRRRPRVDTGIGTVRRLYFYLVSFVTLMMAANGVMLIGLDLLDRLFVGTAVSTSTTKLAWGLALIIIGLPLWAFHWRAMTRHVTALPVETRSELRKIYLYLVLGVALTFVLVSAPAMLVQIFRTADFRGFPWAAVAVWSLVWMFHWRLESDEGQDTPETVGIRRFYLYVVSAVALTMLALGGGRIVHIILAGGYVSAFSVPVLQLEESGIWTSALRSALATLIVGSGAWAAHWLLFARRDHESALRWVYLYVFAILGGIITVMVASGTLINGVLTWAFDALGADSAVDHFDFLPGVIASVAVGVALWAYHWWMAQDESGRSPQLKLGANRTYNYIIAFLGLGTLSAASFVILNTFLTAITESSRDLLSGNDVWKEPVAMAITLAVIGAPMFGFAWRTILGRVAQDDDCRERTALSRKIFTFVVLGAGGLALAGSASATLFVFLRDVLDAGLSLDTVRDVRPAIGATLTAVFILPYQWSVYKADRLAAPG
ncbi:MAG: hypothetical protein IIC24_05165, partial [Chloroflexi bacterium]|nr:hypothetical protein [Chloroflexota bacterium]